MQFHEVITQVSEDNFRDIVNGASREQHNKANDMAMDIIANTESTERARSNAVSLISQVVKPWEVNEWDKMGALIGFYMAIELALHNGFSLTNSFEDAGVRSEVASLVPSGLPPSVRE